MPEEVLEVLHLQERADGHHEDRYYSKDENARFNAVISIRQFDLAGNQCTQLRSQLCDHLVDLEGLHLDGLQMLLHDLLALHEHVAELARLDRNFDRHVLVVLVLNAYLVLALLLRVELRLHFLLAHFFGQFASFWIVDAHDNLRRIRFNLELAYVVHLYILEEALNTATGHRVEKLDVFARYDAQQHAEGGHCEIAFPRH